MKKIIEKLEANFKLASLGLLTFIALVATGTGYSVWSNSTGTVYPGPVASWPTPDKGYIGDPTDVLVNQDANLVGNESIYNMLGKTWYQNANDVKICGFCTPTSQTYWGPGERGHNNPIGCCGIDSSSHDDYCVPKDGYNMYMLSNGANICVDPGVL